MSQGQDDQIRMAGVGDLKASIQNAKDSIAAVTRQNPAMGGALDGVVDVLATIDAQVDKVKEDTHDMQRYAVAATIGDALVGFGTSAARMGQAFSAGRAAEGGGELMKALGSVVKLAFLGQKAMRLASVTAAAWLGPFGSLLGDLMIALGAGLIDGLGPSQKPISEQLREELAEFGGYEQADRLEGVLDALERVHADLHARAPGSLTWDELNKIGRFTGPDEVIALGMAEHWLRRETKAEVWATVFKTYCVVATLALQNFVTGLERMKKRNGDVATADTAIALEVLTTVCRQHQEMLEQFRPKAVVIGMRWFIGDNGNLYYVDQKTDGRVLALNTVVTDLSVTEGEGGKARRAWYLEGGVIHTMMNGAASELDGQYDHFHTAQEPGTGKVYLFTARRAERANPIVTRQVWDESVEPKLVPGSKVLPWSRSPVGDPSVTPVEITRLVGSGDGAVYVVDALGNAWLLDETGSSLLSLPARIKGLATSRDVLYAFDEKRVWSRPYATPVGGRSVWTPVRGPQQDLELAGDAWEIQDVCVSSDDILAAVISKTMYVFDGQHWRPTDGNTARRVVAYPVQGWEAFGGLVSAITSIESVRDALEPVKALTS